MTPRLFSFFAMLRTLHYDGLKKYGALLLLLALALSGCSPLVKGLLYPHTEHGKCIQKCQDEYKRTKDAYPQATCKERCDRDLGWEESRPSRLGSRGQVHS
jgi:hypothetical protein